MLMNFKMSSIEPNYNTKDFISSRLRNQRDLIRLYSNIKKSKNFNLMEETNIEKRSKIKRLCDRR